MTYDEAIQRAADLANEAAACDVDANARANVLLTASRIFLDIAAVTLGPRIPA